jgi:uncharacterized protein YicC (UPF0701 family)
MAATKTRKKGEMSGEHLQALANGRTEGAVVRRYLVALEAHKPKRGRKRTPASIKKRIDAINAQIAKSDPLVRVHLLQERMDLEHELEAIDDALDLKTLEEEFIKAAKKYAERKHISYAAWREAGVDAAVLKRAGITRATHGEK